MLVLHHRIGEDPAGTRPVLAAQPVHDRTNLPRTHPLVVQPRLTDELIDAERAVLGHEAVLDHRLRFAHQRVPLLEADRVAVELDDRLRDVVIVLAVQHLGTHVGVVVDDGRALPPPTDGGVAQPGREPCHVVVDDRPERQAVCTEVRAVTCTPKAPIAVARGGGGRSSSERIWSVRARKSAAADASPSPRATASSTSASGGCTFRRARWPWSSAQARDDRERGTRTPETCGSRYSPRSA